jgi:hypothetical protein
MRPANGSDFNVLEKVAAREARALMVRARGVEPDPLAPLSLLNRDSLRTALTTDGR